jgi:hypothetical protein
MSVVTVGTKDDNLLMDTAHGQEAKRLITHYACPSFAMNEVCRSSSDPICEICFVPANESLSKLLWNHQNSRLQAP